MKEEEEEKEEDEDKEEDEEEEEEEKWRDFRNKRITNAANETKKSNCQHQFIVLCFITEPLTQTDSDCQNNHH